MRKLFFKIVPGETKTPEQYFTRNDNVLLFNGTIERLNKLQGLVLMIGDAKNGEIRRPLTDTRLKIREDISNYGCCWFEWTSTDRDYNAEVELHNQ